jgi:hypothetical protein
MKIPWDKVWDIVINKAHVAIACACQGAIFVFHWKTGKDIGANVQGTVFSFYAFLAGHFGASQVWPDKNTPPTPPTGNPQ